ncbi:MAG: hypothetical protein RL740_3 [Actinomycetota bacterium]
MVYGSLIRTGVRISSLGVKAMSNIRRSRRANIRLARFLVVLSLTTVFGAGFAMQAGAGSNQNPAKSQSYVTITIAPGESLWSVAKAMGSNDPRQLVDQIITINSLKTADIPAGTQIRVPLDKA